MTCASMSSTASRLPSASGLELRVVGGPDVERLFDELHAATVEEVIRRLRRQGWVAEPEVTFSVYGERGSIDIPAWHPPAGALLVGEVKTALGDVQATLAAFDRKIRLARRLAYERGWRAGRFRERSYSPRTGWSAG